MEHPVLTYAVIGSPVGGLTLLATVRGICRVVIGGTPEEVLALYGPQAANFPADFEAAAIQLAEYFQGRRQKFTVPLDPGGISDFAGRVMAAMERIPYGQTRSYAWMAEEIARPGAARAVGRACGANPLPIFVPCHRVVSAGGGLGGYTPGIEVKRKLLALEKSFRGGGV